MESNAINKPSARGFAAMTPDRQRQIASRGGVAVSKDRDYMAQIGRKGGEATKATKKLKG